MKLLISRSHYCHYFSLLSSMSVIATAKIQCYHCGEDCLSDNVRFDEKIFCCEGCSMVYQIINQNGLCSYYSLNESPGINQRISVRNDKFAFLDDKTIGQQLITFQNEEQTHVVFYLPQIHCSSCLYLLENLYTLDPGIISSKVNFSSKEVEIVFLNKKTSLRRSAELLASIGYEPYISLHDLGGKRPPVNKSLIYQVGGCGILFWEYNAHEFS